MESDAIQPRRSLPISTGATRHLADAAVLAVVLATVFLVWRRLFYGVDFTDESFYVALPYRFALGDIPLKDEQNLAQFAGVLAWPLVRLFLWLSGGAEGLVLFMRHLHLGFTALVGLSVFLPLRSVLYWRAALLTACVCLVFVPFNIHGLSYNTMGCGFLTMGCFLSLYAREDRANAAWPWLLCGVSHFLAILVYPTLAAAALVFAIMVWVSRGASAPRRPLSLYLAGALLAAVLPVWLLWRAGLESLPAIAGYLDSFDRQSGGLGKFVEVAVAFWRDAPKVGYLLAAMAVLGIWHALRPALLRYLLPLLPLLLLAYSDKPNGTDSLYVIIAVALMGCFAYPFVAGNEFARKLMHWVWAPSFVGGFVTAWSSGNGTVNGCIGMFPAALAAIVLMQLALRTAPATVRGAKVALETMVLAVPLMIIAPLLEGGYADFYGEPVRFSQLTERVAAGPFKDIRTTPEKLAFIRDFARTAPLIGTSDRILVFNDFPAGYLLAGVRPAVNSLWLPPASTNASSNRASTLKYWETTGKWPDVVLLLTRREVVGDPLVDRLRAAGYRPEADFGFTTLLRRRAAP